MVDIFEQTSINDTLATAQALATGTYNITGVGQDYWRIDAINPGLMTFRMTPDVAAGVNVNLELHNSAGQAIASNFDPSGPLSVEQISRISTGNETYYLKVYNAAYPAAGHLAPKYTLDVTLPTEVWPQPIYEDNNTLATAKPLGAGEFQISGRGFDWFSIATNPGATTLVMTPSTGADVNMELYNSAGQAIQSAFAAGQETITFNADGGTYFIRTYLAATPETGSPHYRLNISLSNDVWGPPAYEANDSFQTAKTLTEGNYRISGRNEDWFSFATNPGAATLTMTPAQTTDVNMELYDSTGTALIGNFASGQETIRFNADGGTYYVRLYKPATPGQGVLFYNLNLDIADEVWPQPRFEPNDTRETAPLLGEGNYRISGTNGDYFRIDGKPGQMTFSMTPVDGMNMNLELLDSAGNAVKSNTSNGFGAAGKETFSYWSLFEQTYYLRVFNAGTPTGRGYYDLSVDLPTGTWAKELDFGPIRDASVAFFDIDNDGKDEIFVGTSKHIDAAGNEVRPAGLIALEDDGSVKWTVSFPGMTTPDPATGKTYKTTSISTAPLFTDLDGDGSMDIVIGVGADKKGQFGAVGQPGDKGGLYAVSATGQIKWYFETKDLFGGMVNGLDLPDGRPDGVYSDPVAFDIDSDGVREVIFTSWDHHLYFLDGRTGAKEREIDLHDTNGATPKLVDINRDGVFEIITGGDITKNPSGGIPETGGILHMVSAYGNQNTPGWNLQVGTTTNPDFRGFFSPQVIWSGPQTADLDGDGVVEVIHGTGDFFKDARGDFVNVRNADGTLRFSLPTIGRPATSPLIADLDGDGRQEIIQVTFSGYVHAWNWQGQQLFATKLKSFGTPDDAPLALDSPPSAIDLDGDGKLELLIAAGSQLAVVNHLGVQRNDATQREFIYQNYSGSIGVSDVDNDGRLDIVSGGTNVQGDKAVIYRWENPYSVNAATAREVAYQSHQNLTNIDKFVERFYSTILKRTADAAGNNYWNDNLYTGVNSGADVARGFIFSQEFLNQNVDNATFVNTLYSAFFNRPADTGGFNGWLSQLQGGTSRSAVLDGFIFSQEFTNLSASFGIRAASSFGPDAGPGNNTVNGSADSDVLRGGDGNDFLLDQGTAMPTNPDIPQHFGQIYRLYAATLNREPDSAGFLGWVNGLGSNLTLPQVTESFVGSQEFTNRYGTKLTSEEFVTLLYNNVLGRAPDAAGLKSWTDALAKGTARWEVVNGFADSQEHINKTSPKLTVYMEKIDTRWNDVMEGGAGNDTMSGGIGADTYIFRAGLGGNDTIYQFESWDVLQLSGFGYKNAGQALARMTQQGADVVFADQGQTITFKNTKLAAFNKIRWNLS